MLTSYEKSFPTVEKDSTEIPTIIENKVPTNDFVYDIFYKSNKTALETEWEKFWSGNGERLIWASWIEKYAAYINPDYLKDFVDSEKISTELQDNFPEQNTCFPNEAHKNCDIERTNFEGIFSNNTKATQELNVIDRKSPEPNLEGEKIVTKCDSVNESITRTNATSDSMTCVTKMTLSSSSCDSNSLHLSSLISSVTSSIESNVTNNSWDQDHDFSNEDGDKYWQNLWRENFHVQYRKQYEIFASTFANENHQKGVEKQNILIDPTLFKENQNSRKKKMIIESVGMLLQNLNVKSDDTNLQQESIHENEISSNALIPR